MVKNTLRKKLFRDMGRAFMQFLSIIVLCALGTFAFAALDGTARMTRTTLDTYFEENNLADFWVTIPSGADRQALDTLRQIPGVRAVRARALTDLDMVGRDGVSVGVTAYDGEMDINIPLLREGELLDPSDARGCLVEERFAVAQGLTLGDRLTVKLAGQEITFIVKGVCVSPEYIVVSNGVSADPDSYGYILVNARAVPALPLTQAVVTIERGSAGVRAGGAAEGLFAAAGAVKGAAASGIAGIAEKLGIAGIASAPEAAQAGGEDFALAADSARGDASDANLTLADDTAADNAQRVAAAAPDEDEIERLIQAALPDALVVNRGAHMSTARANNDAEMFENMTLIFPVLAYAIAALIVMTTLSRMIDNQRMQMGTLGALGFSARQIRGHYLSYAIVPSFVGALLGTAVGHYTLPIILWDALIGQNEMPYRLEPPISTPAFLMVALTVAMSTGICYYTYRQSARETTAALLRPKPPKDGKRILLERITPLWTRLSFNAKMIVRNVMRNKLRSFMSFLGILCCTMLLITSMGLQDSVKTMSRKYYTETLDYDLRANLTGEAGEAESYERRLAAKGVECVMEKSVSLRAEGGTRTVRLSVLGDAQTMQRIGENETLLTLDTGTVAVTYKLTRTLGIRVGDTVRMYLPGDDDPVDMQVGQIAYNNVSQGVYMNRTTWESLRKGAFVPTAIQLRAPEEATVAELEDMDEVDSLDVPARQIDEMLEMLDALQSVFAMLTGIALALAFVICYNMGLMNFVERTREYATLKVLGYHQKEIRRLILRENTIISLLGVAGGIFPGIALTDVIMHSCEPETGFYPGTPTLQSIVIACIVTYLFSGLLQRLLARKVRSIDMVEALKSVE